MADDFQVEDFDDVQEYGAVAPEGRYTVSLVKMESKISNSKKPMLVGTSVIDSGDFMGTKMLTYFVVGGGVKIGWKLLKKLANAADFRWGAAKNPAALAAQFTDLDEPLRYMVKVGHARSIKVGSTWKNNVSEKEYNEFIEQGGDEFNIRPEIRDFYPLPDDDEGPEMALSFDVAQEEDKILSPDEIEDDNEVELDDDDPDDDLPF